VSASHLSNYGTAENPWRAPDGSVIACHEKLKVMNENLHEFQEAAMNALEDAVLMGCSEDQVKAVLGEIISRLATDYQAL
jgi:hypothetical protein